MCRERSDQAHGVTAGECSVDCIVRIFIRFHAGRHARNAWILLSRGRASLRAGWTTRFLVEPAALVYPFPFLFFFYVQKAVEIRLICSVSLVINSKTSLPRTGTVCTASFACHRTRAFRFLARLGFHCMVMAKCFHRGFPLERSGSVSFSERPQSPHPACFWHPRLLRSRNARSAAGTGFGGLARSTLSFFDDIVSAEDISEFSNHRFSIRETLCSEMPAHAIKPC